MKEILGIVLIYVAAIALGLAFSWKITIGISFLILLLQSIFQTNVNIKK